MVNWGEHMEQSSGQEDDGISTGRLRRAAPVAGMAARTAGEAIIASLRRRPSESDGYARRAERYVELLGRSKGALMKAGQILSIVPFGSAVPPENRALLQGAMSRLQAEAPPMAPELAAEVVRSELGASPDEVFAEFSARPLAAASIGQVHAARLRDGRPVAVKVQYPGVADAIRADLRNAELLAVFLQLLRSIVPGLSRTDPRELAAEISERITEELDYCIEASNQQLFADAYRGHPFIHVPEIIWELSTGRVLTQDLAEGLRWPQALQADRALRDRWGEAMFRFFFGGLREVRAYNTDPHPGNYLFRSDGSVSFLDFGCVKRLHADQVLQGQDTVRAVMHQDADALWRIFIELGVFDATKAPAPEEILEWYSHSFEMLLAPQPFTFTPEVVAREIQAEFSATGNAGRIVRSARAVKDYVFITRIDLGLTAVLGELRATADWRSIQAELDEGAPPSTEMGKAAAEFRASHPLKVA
jgi:predicted unusual protein kinase regulating ubiquinone biosynthesis (AarF/ABC1/UbiB family)